ncbi:FG-GAP-like repeat-containing protein, partial [Myxococcota bacterium]|nr:FG-GAP-like repeat-containing protein [Myxococcota bacterium]
MSPRSLALAAPWTVLLATLLVGCGGPAPSDPRVAAADVPAGWLDEVQERIAASEYRFRPAGTSFEATNRAQDYRARFDASGVVLTPRSAQAGYRLDLRVAAWGREDSLRPPTTATPAEGPCLATGEVDEEGACLRRLDYVRAGIVEWWENRPEGLRQGFTVAARPRGDGPLVVDLAVDGMTPRVEGSGDAATFEAPAGGGLRYSGLAAWDARGRTLAARMEAAGAGLRLVVDDAGAAFPVTIDPVLATHAWSAMSDQAGAQMGGAVASAGDVNGDGYADVVVGAPGWSNGQTSEGRALLYLGSASGLSTTPAWTAESNQATAWFGAAVASAGDVNGDGYSDVIVGAWGYSGGQTGEGRAYLYLGSAAGLASVPSWTAESNQADAWFGISVASAGDVNGDGYSDVIVGASKYDDGHTDEGAAFVYHGSASGLGASPAWTGQIDAATAYFGCSVAGAGDVNADGYSDVIVGAYGYSNGSSGEGGAFAYHGSVSGLAASPNWATESNQASASLGQSVAGVGDVNGDGYGDVVVGVPQYDGGSTDEGRVYAFHGGSGGLATNSAWYEEADSSSANFGYSVAAAGDVNGDGYADVVIGAHNRSNGQTNEGQAHVYVGSSSGLRSTAIWTGESNQTSANFGRAVASAGDVDGDGLADVVVGAPYLDDGETDEGRAYVFLGSGGAPSTLSYWHADSGQSSAYFGCSVSGAGDVNGDGYSDIVVGAYAYDGGDADEGRAYLYLGSAAGLSTSPSWTAESNQAGAAFGYAVAGAGDVNGDGYSDVLVGARTYDDGDTNEGRAYVYHGSSSGLGASPAWTAESNQADAYFGAVVSGAGDVNGDGYSDVIVGAYYYDNGESGEGRAYVYLGSAGGLATAPAWTAEGDQAGAYFGYSVSGAGDVDGDGYGDVVVGAPYFDNGQTEEGRAFVFLGSESGLGASPAWTAESNQASASFGFAVSEAGDVNGDGYGDVIVGAPSYDNGHTDEGRAYVYLGSADGLAASPAWTAEGDQSSAQYGRAVSSAGDVDGDGYGDVIAGALYWDGGYTNEGGAWLYLGSGTGPSETAAWSWTGLQSSAYFGASLASAGDVNGDGFGDLVIGAYNFDNGSSDEGVSFVFHGNSADNTTPAFGLAAQARQPGSTTPIQPAGWSDDTSAFDVAMRGRTPFGRGDVKLQVEAKPPGVPFDGLDLHTGATWADTTLAGVELQETLDSLDGITGYHWRARLRYRPSEGRPQLWSHWVYGGVSGDPLGVHVVTGCGEATWYADGDGDGFGDDATAWLGDCHRPPGYVAVAGDCNDLDPDAYPGADEACNGRDDDCDGTVDEGAMGGGAGGADADGDGYGTCGDEPDCDDGDPTVHPGATETCDGEDDDCDGDADEGFDADGDGYGTCGASPDCADGNPAIHPGATESCNALDDDCDGVADEGFDAD